MRLTRYAMSALLVSSVLMPIVSPASAAPRRTGSAPTVRAVVVKSWSFCDSNLVIWESLNASWGDYGSIPIEIDYSYPGLCDGPVTYDALAASGADVVILSNSAGGLRQFSSQETRALRQYVREGHNVVGTALLFIHHSIDNRGLAPLFGIRTSVRYQRAASVDPTYDLLEPNNRLFVGLPDPYVSSGDWSSQVPTDDSWDEADLRGARFAGEASDSRGVILVHQTPTYVGTYVSSMPEYGGGVQDHQFLYNAITYTAN